MSYTKLQIDNRIQAIHDRYSNFQSIIFQRQDDSGIYLLAMESDNQENYLRLTLTGRLYYHRDNEWRIVNNFIYRDLNE
ncbi:hypothetical protein CSV76_07300 [Sporosarcina sp. P17b]|nr:hypothetical protein CSV76_07300 [Sporosarcina sp. P17b]